MSKTILITGASSGIGKATAHYFQEQGWNVVATMRKPDQEKELTQLENVLVTRLDVTDNTSIQQAIDAGIHEFGSIDVLLNNAGYGLTGVFENMETEEIRRQYEVNVIGLMNVTKAMLPHMRERRSGTIVNVSSMGGIIAIPLYSTYHGTKWAVEGFTESLHYELAPFNIKLKLIEPGAIKTDFYDRSMNMVEPGEITDYQTYYDKVTPKLEYPEQSGAEPREVAKVIFKAARSKSNRLRYPAAGGAGPILFLRSIMPYRIWRRIMKMIME